MSPGAIRELAQEMSRRYREASCPEKTRLLDQFCIITGYHRKSANRLLLQDGAERLKKRRGRPPKYQGGPFSSALLLLRQGSKAPLPDCNDRHPTPSWACTMIMARSSSTIRSIDVEQRNGSLVRRLFGYGRYTSKETLDVLWTLEAVDPASERIQRLKDAVEAERSQQP